MQLENPRMHEQVHVYVGSDARKHMYYIGNSLTAAFLKDKFT